MSARGVGGGGGNVAAAAGGGPGDAGGEEGAALGPGVRLGVEKIEGAVSAARHNETARPRHGGQGRQRRRRGKFQGGPGGRRRRWERPG